MRGVDSLINFVKSIEDISNQKYSIVYNSTNTNCEYCEENRF